MSANDLIRRGDVKAKKVYCNERHEYVVPVAEIDWLSPVTQHEMTAREFAKQYHRMCEEYSDCDGCPFADNTPCEGWISNYMIDMVAIVEKWAREHPERSEE